MAMNASDSGQWCCVLRQLQVADCSCVENLKEIFFFDDDGVLIHVVVKRTKAI